MELLEEPWVFCSTLVCISQALVYTERHFMEAMWVSLAQFGVHVRVVRSGLYTYEKHSYESHYLQSARLLCFDLYLSHCFDAIPS